MASEKQIEANRANAQASTGPRTPEGKAAVSQNACKHGLRSRMVVRPTEDQAEYDAHSAGLYAEWQPQTPTEDALVEKMVIALWKQARYEKIERDLIADLINQDPKTLAMLWRQQASVERLFSRALADLQRLRKFRASAPAKPVAAASPEEHTVPPAPPKPEPPEYVMHPCVPVPPSPAVPSAPPAG